MSFLVDFIRGNPDLDDKSVLKAVNALAVPYSPEIVRDWQEIKEKLAATGADAADLDKIEDKLADTVLISLWQSHGGEKGDCTVEDVAVAREQIAAEDTIKQEVVLIQSLRQQVVARYLSVIEAVEAGDLKDWTSIKVALGAS